MVMIHCSILGGLPVVASVWFSGPDHDGEYDSGVDELFWRRRDGSAGGQISEKTMDRLERYDDYWQADVTEQANDWLGEHCPTRRRNPEWNGYSLHGPPEYIEEGEYSPEYRLLNPGKFNATTLTTQAQA